MDRYEMLLGLIIAAIVILAAALLYWGNGVREEADARNNDRLGTYVGEDNHVRVTQNIDIPLPYVPEVAELDGDADAAAFWGTHPSS